MRDQGRGWKWNAGVSRSYYLFGRKKKNKSDPAVSGLHRVKVFYNERLLKEFSIFALDQQMITLLTEKAKQNPALEQILKNL